MSELRPAVFLDRDGTLNVERDLVRAPADLELIPTAGSALRRLASAGFLLIVVTNQSARARGTLSASELEDVHEHLKELLEAEGVELTDILHCPHHPTEGEPPLRVECDCRKPAPGMLLRAAAAHQIDLSRSWLIGDAARDIEAGARAGVQTALVLTGKGESEQTLCSPDLISADIAAAAKELLACR